MASTKSVANRTVSLVDPPIRFCSTVAKGFQRGSKELGWPTANLDNSAAVYSTLQKMDTGIYCGWASVGNVNSDLCIYKAAISVGHNPTFKGTEATQHKVVEPYLLHEFAEDFYGEEIRLVVCGYIRPEADFSGEIDFMTALKNAIGADVVCTDKALDCPKFAHFAGDNFLKAATPATFAASVLEEKNMMGVQR
eukprot:GSMAST32.ASY1.ANO1.732.1 assembled CDS